MLIYVRVSSSEVQLTLLAVFFPISWEKKLKANLEAWQARKHINWSTLKSTTCGCLYWRSSKWDLENKKTAAGHCKASKFLWKENFAENIVCLKIRAPEMWNKFFEKFSEKSLFNKASVVVKVTKWSCKSEVTGKNSVDNTTDIWNCFFCKSKTLGMFFFPGFRARLFFR